MFVAFATPSYQRTVCLEFLQSMLATSALLNSKGIENGFLALGGDCFVDKARNEIVAAFMGTPATDLFFIDDDIGWNPEAVLKVLSHPEEIVAGIYPRKEDAEGYPVICDLQDERLIMRDSLIKVKTVGSGFMRIKRSAIENMMVSYPETYTAKYAGQSNPPVMYELFKSGVVNGQFCGEDTQFCDRWTAIGGEIWLEPDIDFVHVGRKAYKGNFAKFVNSKG